MPRRRSRSQPRRRSRSQPRRRSRSQPRRRSREHRGGGSINPVRCPYESHPVFCGPKGRRNAWCVPGARDLPATRRRSAATRISAAVPRNIDVYCDWKTADIERERRSPGKKKPLEALLQHLIAATAELYQIQNPPNASLRMHQSSILNEARAVAEAVRDMTEAPLRPEILQHLIDATAELYEIQNPPSASLQMHPSSILNQARAVAEAVRDMTEVRPLRPERAAQLRIVVGELEELSTRKQDFADSAADVLTSLAAVTLLLGEIIVDYEQEVGEEAAESQSRRPEPRRRVQRVASPDSASDYEQEVGEEAARASDPVEILQDLQSASSERERETAWRKEGKVDFMDKQSTRILHEIDYQIKVLFHFENRLKLLKSKLPQQDYINFLLAVKNVIKFLLTIKATLSAYQKDAGY